MNEEIIADQEKITERPIVSVIVALYNVERFVEKAVYSLCGQTVERIQIILVDDCSTDKTAEKCKEICRRDERVTLMGHKQNHGVSAARNTGLQIAEGKYIYFMDGDDLLEKDCLEFLIRLMESCEKCDMAVCGYYMNNKIITEKKHTPVVMSRLEAARACIGVDGYKMNGYVVNKLFKREIILKNGLRFDEQIFFSEDLLFCQEYLKKCNVIYYSAIPKYHYIYRKESATHGLVTKRSMTCFNALDKVMECCRDYADNRIDQYLLEAEWQNSIVILKNISLHYAEEQFPFGEALCRKLRGKELKILRAERLTWKNKISFWLERPLFYIRYRILKF